MGSSFWGSIGKGLGELGGAKAGTAASGWDMLNGVMSLDSMLGGQQSPFAQQGRINELKEAITLLKSNSPNTAIAATVKTEQPKLSLGVNTNFLPQQTKDPYKFEYNIQDLFKRP